MPYSRLFAANPHEEIAEGGCSRCGFCMAVQKPGMDQAAIGMGFASHG
jgi:hypothetical protein